MSTLSLKNINLNSDDPVKVTVVNDDSSIHSEVLVKQITDSDSNVGPNDYRIKRVLDDGTDSFWTQIASTQVYLSDGYNEFRVKGVSQLGLSSDWVQAVVYKEPGEQTVVEGSLLGYCFDVFNEYFNDYLAEVFLTPELKDEIDFEALLGEMEKDLYTVFEDLFGLEFNEVIDIIFTDLVKQSEMLDLNVIEEATLTQLFELGPDYFMEELDSFIAGFVEMYIESSLQQSLNQINEQVNVNFKNRSDLDNTEHYLIDLFTTRLKNELVELYTEFQLTDMALFAIKDIGHQILVSPSFESELGIATSDLVEVYQDFVADYKSELGIATSDLVEVYQDFVADYKEVQAIETSDEYKLLWGTALEDIMVTSMLDQLGFVDIDLKLFSNNVVEITNTVTAIVYNDDSSTKDPVVALSDELTNQIDAYFREQEIDLDIEIDVKDQITNFALYELLDFIMVRDFAEYLDLNFADLVTISEVFKHSFIDTLGVNLSEDVFYSGAYSLTDKSRVTILDLAPDVLVESAILGDEIALRLLDGEEAVDFELDPDSLACANIDDRMGISVMGCTPMGQGG